MATLPVGPGGLIYPSQDGFLPPTLMTRAKPGKTDQLLWLTSFHTSGGSGLVLPTSSWDPFPAAPGRHTLGQGHLAGLGAPHHQSAPSHQPTQKPPRPGPAVSPNWPPSCLGPQTGSQSRRSCVGEMPEMNTGTACCKWGLVGEEPRHRDWTVVQIPHRGPAVVVSVPSGLVLPLGPCHQPLALGVTALSWTSTWPHAALLEPADSWRSCRWTHSQGGPRESHPQEGWVRAT